MKKIMLLGGSAQQIVAIETAKKLGYYTILCDYLEDNPGKCYADKFYLESTTDREAILDVAQKEKIDGILAYASDPAAPTAAYVAEKLELPTSPYKSVDTLCNKDKFRKFLKNNGFNSPKSFSCGSIEEINDKILGLKFPVIIKPVDSSGSKGITVIKTTKEIEQAFNYAYNFSRRHQIIIEEYIEKDHPFIIGGDIFVYHGEIVLWGLLNCHRDEEVNNLVPVGKSFPLELPDEYLKNVKDTIRNMIKKLQIDSCEMNVELIVDKNGNVWPIDIGPRSGGNMIPDFLGLIFGVNVIELSILSAMNKKINVKNYECDAFYATHNVHSPIEGILKNVIFKKELNQYIVKKVLYKNPGEKVEYFDYSSKALGIIFMKFPSKEIMNKILENINKFIIIDII